MYPPILPCLKPLWVASSKTRIRTIFLYRSRRWSSSTATVPSRDSALVSSRGSSCVSTLPSPVRSFSAVIAAPFSHRGTFRRRIPRARVSLNTSNVLETYLRSVFIPPAEPLVRRVAPHERRPKRGCGGSLHASARQARRRSLYDLEE